MTNFDKGTPHKAGFGTPAVMSAGMAERGKYQIVTASLVHSVA